MPAIANIPSDQPTQELTENPVFPVNQNGETYGQMGSVNLAGQQPDLLLVAGVDGTVGYLKKADAFGDQPNTPEEAMAYMEKQEQEKNNGPKMIPMYDSDGKTVIGEFRH